ncbi:MAG: glycosyltransferase family 4 protein [Acidobacteria bacterium]|nr:glycosyltransferase family 4 protein [Acidobacteriota bacterium]
MRILIAAASFAANISGLQRHALNLAHCMLDAQEVESIHFVVAPWQQDIVSASGLQHDTKFVLHVAEMDRSSIARNAWYYRKLPALARAVRADLVHLSYPMPVDTSALPCPTVVSLHDLYPYEIPMNFGFPKFIFNRLALRQCLGAVDSIACVSEATKRKLQKYLPGFSKKAVRIYNNVEPHDSQHVLQPGGWNNGPFLLCVAQHRKNKNLMLLIRAFRRLITTGAIAAQTRLLIVGITGPETRAIRQLISQSSIEEQVLLREGLSEAELQWCYRNCEALVSPSITEGFGLPVAEALLAGSRVVCSEITAHWEIGAGRCRFVNLQYDGERKLAEAIVASLDEPKPRPVELAELSARRITRQYADLYLRLLSPVLEPPLSEAIPATTSGSRLP